MNKELINKYKPEFDHWLNEGSVLINSDLGWCPIAKEFTWSCNISVDALLVINDEYSEFRKALAEGETIQINNSNPETWIDIDTDKLAHYNPSFLRIKPDESKFKIPAYFKELSSGIVVKFTEEISSNCFGTIVESSLQIPQKNKGFEWRCWDIFSHPERWEYLPNYNEPKFKVGDFVTPLNREINCSVWQIDKVLSCNTLVSGSTMLDPRTIQLWMPVKGEWCWFYDNPKKDKYCNLSQFGEESNGRCFKTNSGTPWLFCEPFLNSLPSYFKDK